MDWPEAFREPAGFGTWYLFSFHVACIWSLFLPATDARRRMNGSVRDGRGLGLMHPGPLSFRKWQALANPTVVCVVVERPLSVLSSPTSCSKLSVSEPMFFFFLLWSPNSNIPWMQTRKRSLTMIAAE
ncbi:hypothetical protein QBC35DRAFT_148834 [Podospora australis]|uniref:Uncharacterized protein n=1 Tax=Podospora australis TaxID=1536484 RepID=A0AAN6WZE4_9PEZI|nr:hypothetical protein QBC35DRAFT_148834 [Podospora australis]